MTHPPRGLASPRRARYTPATLRATNPEQPRRTQRVPAHDAAHHPHTLFYGDNLPILRDHIADASVDLVYLDPPFNSSRNYKGEMLDSS